jgi:hypothetical protein
MVTNPFSNIILRFLLYMDHDSANRFYHFMKMIIPRMCVLISSVLLCNCASIFSKSDYPVTFTAAKAKKVTVQNRVTKSYVYSGMTPTTLTLSASQGYFKPAKYDIITAHGTQGLEASMDPWYAGNILIGGLIGGLIDPATGAMWKLPKEVQVLP